MLIRDTNMAFDQRKYINEFNKGTYKMFPFRVRKDNKAIMEKLKTVPNVNKYILSLIDNDVNRSVLTIKQIKERILPVLAKHNIYEVYLFGSYSRGEANPDSDVDIYCEKGDVRTFIDQGFLEDELVEALGKEIDIIFFGTTMNDWFKQELDKDKIKIN